MYNIEELEKDLFAINNLEDRLKWAYFGLKLKVLI